MKRILFGNGERYGEEYFVCIFTSVNCEESQ